MRFAVLAAAMSWTLVASAQDAPKPSITVEEIMEKSIQATGGKDNLQKMKTIIATGTMEIVAMGGTASTELYSKAPNKRYTFTNVDGYGEIKAGFDGTIGWSSEPQNGLVQLKGAQLATAKRDATFNGALFWKELYPTSEVVGKQKVGDRDCWVVKLTPAEGTPVTHFYDVETGLLAKMVATADTMQGPAEIGIKVADYKDLGNGVKFPFTMTIDMPGIGDLITKYKEIKVNAEIDDAKFAMPKN
jgi:zinc protease